MRLLSLSDVLLPLERASGSDPITCTLTYSICETASIPLVLLAVTMLFYVGFPSSPVFRFVGHILSGLYTTSTLQMLLLQVIFLPRRKTSSISRLTLLQSRHRHQDQ